MVFMYYLFITDAFDLIKISSASYWIPFLFRHSFFPISTIQIYK